MDVSVRTARPGCPYDDCRESAFLGELTGDLVAFNAETSDELFGSTRGDRFGGGVVTYAVDGRQYAAVSSGDPSSLNWRTGHDGSPTVLVFALPG